MSFPHSKMDVFSASRSPGGYPSSGVPLAAAPTCLRFLPHRSRQHLPEVLGLTHQEPTIKVEPLVARQAKRHHLQLLRKVHLGDVGTTCTC